VAESNNHDYGLMRRAAIVGLALLLMAAQSFAVAHYHQQDFRDNVSHAVQGGDALCSLCWFHFHAPANAATPPEVGRELFFVSRLTPGANAVVHALAIARVFSRGPPSSL
jgi:hypothetical protein